MDEIDLRDDPTESRAGASDTRDAWAKQSTPSRDWDAYEAMYVAHVNDLHRLALLLCHGDRGRAEDVVSDVFVQAWPAWSGGKILDFRAYARRAVVNAVKGHVRHGVVVDRFLHRHRAADRDDRPVADEIAEREVLWSALRELPIGQRTAVVLRFYEDLSVDETAAIMGVAAGTVKSQVSDAMRSLQRVLDPMEQTR